MDVAVAQATENQSGRLGAVMALDDQEPGTRAGSLAWAAEAEVRGDDGEIAFRCFRLLPGARILLRDGEPVEIGSRAFDLLHVLLKSRGAIVSKDEIFASVWPTTLVDESNLRFQVSCLRRVLGEDRDLIRTVAGRGYLLAGRSAPVQKLAGTGAASSDGDRHAANTQETCEALRRLLRSVLDELWEMTSNGDRAAAFEGGASGASSWPLQLGDRREIARL